MILENLVAGSEVHWQLARFFLVLFGGLTFVRVVMIPIIDKLVSRKSDSVTTQASLQNFVGIFSAFIVFTFALQAAGFGGLVTVFGTVTAALTVAIGFGMREEVGSLVSGVFIQLDNPFVKGDYIKVNDVEGVIDEIQLRSTILKTSGSEKLVMPNRVLTANGVKNYTKGKKTKTSISVKTPVETVEKAREILVKKANQNEEVLEKPEPETVINRIEDGKTEVELHYWINSPGKVSRVRSEILEKFSKDAKRRKVFKEYE